MDLSRIPLRHWTPFATPFAAPIEPLQHLSQGADTLITGSLPALHAREGMVLGDAAV